MRSTELIRGYAVACHRAASSPGQLARLRERLLRRMLVHAWDETAHYRRSFGDAGLSRDDLAAVPIDALPTLDKGAFMEEFDDIVAVPDVRRADLASFDADANNAGKLYRGRYHVVRSSGSTGRPGYFLYDEGAWSRMLLGVTRGALWGLKAPAVMRLLRGRPRVLYVAAVDGRYGGAMAVGDGVHQLGLAQMNLDINTPLSRWVDGIREFDPTVIVGYPSALKILGELADAGRISPHVKRVISCGEPLSPGLRLFLGKTLGTPVINFYGASESLALGVELDPAEGMFLFDDLNWVEFADDGMYLTSLYNYAQPLVRYRISDRLRPLSGMPQPAAGGCPFTRIESVQGRSEDMLWFEDGEGVRDFVHPLAVEGFCVEGLLDYQFRKVGSAAFEMMAEVPDVARRPAVRDEISRQMAGILDMKDLGWIDFKVRFVEAIMPDPVTGKKRLTVSSQEDDYGWI